MSFWCPLDQVAYLSVCPLVSMWLVDQVGLFVCLFVFVHYIKFVCLCPLDQFGQISVEELCSSGAEENLVTI